MSLMSKARAISSAAKEYQSLEKMKEFAQQTREKTEQLIALRKALADDLSRRSALVAAGFSVPDWPTFDTLLNALSQFDAALESDSSAGAREFGSLAKEMQRVVKNVSATVCKQLDARKKSVLDAIDPSLVRSYGELDEHSAVVQQILAARVKLESTDWAEQDGDSLAALLDMARSAVASAEQVLEADVPQAVRDFFAAAKAGGATIEQLDSVRSWLESNGQLDRLRVRSVGR